MLHSPLIVNLDKFFPQPQYLLCLERILEVVKGETGTNISNCIMSNRATWQKRFINYIIDAVCIIVLFIILLRIIPYLVKGLPFDFEIDINIILLIVYVLYYLLLESLTGKTVGKLLTRTRVVNYQGKRPSVGQIIARTLIRLLFIEVFSFMTRVPDGWHDRVSNTEVIV